MTADANRTVRKRSWAHTLLRAGMVVVAFVGLVAFSVVLAKVTLTPSPASAGIAHSNMTPGRSLRQYAEDYTFLAACKQAGGNILLGVPFGVLLPVLVPRRLRMLRMILLTGVVMVVVELAQGAVVEGRAFDIDDVILNTAGALLGYLLVGRRISHHYHSFASVRPEPAAVPAPKPAPAVGGASGGRTSGMKRLGAKMAKTTGAGRSRPAKSTADGGDARSGKATAAAGSERAAKATAAGKNGRTARSAGGRTLFEKLRNR